MIFKRKQKSLSWKDLYLIIEIFGMEAANIRGLQMSLEEITVADLLAWIDEKSKEVV